MPAIVTVLPVHNPYHPYPIPKTSLRSVHSSPMHSDHLQTIAPTATSPSTPSLLMSQLTLHHPHSSIKLDPTGWSAPKQLPTKPSLITLTIPSMTALPINLPDRSTSPSRATLSVISYLKAWRPPVEYYARRRRHHPSLSPPSRRPSLPALLEEQITPEGHLDLVRPELVIRSSPFSTARSNCRCPSCYLSPIKPLTSSPCSRVESNPCRMPGLDGWDDDSDDDLDLRDEGSMNQLSDEDDDQDEDDWSDSDSIEAVTPVNSPDSTTGYFLQPLFLTKPPGC